ncbi:2-dehydro-3-deoxygluconokinase [Microbispora rosea]|uniref:2-dehydro-3-deoxygluconokinase n=1 Tax=Microbispora rosea TaxID=58117 RepID=A0A1N7HBX1_9ACTN|nr:sugar kinase [Microbispora rosea]GIH52521.1 2-keto-3-deoxygluconate kinase [Microbispora rosea subsp. rosea]SIS22312.1 2-dehydro-3-deoxygluconokinase [Microbispora rosea]
MSEQQSEGPVSGPRVEVSTLGEAMVRLSPPAGERLRDCGWLRVHVGGAEANVAVALASVGVSARWTSALPDTVLGRRVADSLSSAGVVLDTVRWVADERLGLYFAEIGSPPRPTSVLYDRAGTVFGSLRVDDLDWAAVCEARIIHLTGITAALAPGSDALVLRTAREGRERGALVVYDVNYRSALSSPETAASFAAELAPDVDLLICRAEDARDLFGLSGDPLTLASELARRLAVGRVVVTAGAGGAVAHWDGESFAAPALPTVGVDRIGAGDAFAAGVLWGVLDDSPEDALRRGTAMASLAMSVQGDQCRFSAEEVLEIARGGGREVRR